MFYQNMNPTQDVASSLSEENGSSKADYSAFFEGVFCCLVLDALWHDKL
jgi:hypothetical protein